MKMPTKVGIFKKLAFSYLLAENVSCSVMFSKKEFAIVNQLRFISRTNFMLSWVEHENNFMTWGLEQNCTEDIQEKPQWQTIALQGPASSHQATQRTNKTHSKQPPGHSKNKQDPQQAATRPLKEQTRPTASSHQATQRTNKTHSKQPPGHSKNKQDPKQTATRPLQRTNKTHSKQPPGPSKNKQDSQQAATRPLK